MDRKEQPDDLNIIEDGEHADREAPYLESGYRSGRSPSNSGIEWTDTTWNCVVGCSRVSPGCEHCYAERVTHRGMHEDHKGLTVYGRMGVRWNGVVRTLPHRLRDPLMWKQPRKIFVNSLSDLLHEKVPDEFIAEVFAVMREAHWHEFQILTKRHERLPYLDEIVGEWPPNVWMGVSVENADYAKRIEFLRRCGAAIKWASLEPLLGPLTGLDFTGLDWVVAGGESGPGARPMHPSWVREIRDRCIKQRVPFHFKQWGAYGPDGVKRSKSRNGRELDGRTWDEWPLTFANRREGTARSTTEKRK